MKATRVLCPYCEGKKQLPTTTVGKESPYMGDCVGCNGNGFLLALEKNALEGVAFSVEIKTGQS